MSAARMILRAGRDVLPWGLRRVSVEHAAKKYGVTPGPKFWDDRYNLRGSRPRRRRATAAPVTERPPMPPRNEGMTRQVQRAIYRRMCKLAGIPWRAS